MTERLPSLASAAVIIERDAPPWWGYLHAYCAQTERVLAVIDRQLVSMDAVGEGALVIASLFARRDEEDGDDEFDSDECSFSHLMASESFALLWSEEARLLRVFDRRSNEPVAVRAASGLDGACLVDETVIVTIASVDRGRCVRRQAKAIDLRSGEQRWVADLPDRGAVLDRSYAAFSAAEFALIRSCTGDEWYRVTVADGAVRVMSDVAATNGEHTLVRNPWNGWDLVRTRTLTVVARVAMPSTLASENDDASVFALSRARFLLSIGAQLVVIECDPPALVAATAIERRTRGPYGDGCLVVGDRVWLPPVDDAAIEEPVTRDECVRLASIAADASATIERVTLGAKRSVPEFLPVDLERLRAIVAVVDEETELNAARDRLIGRGVIPEGFDPLARSATLDGSAPTFRYTELSRRAWVSAAYDARAIETAELLAREAIERWRPWIKDQRTLEVRWWTGLLDCDREHEDGPWRALRDAFSLRKHRTITSSRPTLTCAEWFERDALWREASASQLRIANEAPAFVAGRAFREVPSPYEPLVAMFELGISPLSVTDTTLVLGRALLWDLATGRRESCAWRV